MRKAIEVPGSPNPHSLYESKKKTIWSITVRSGRVTGALEGEFGVDAGVRGVGNLGGNPRNARGTRGTPS